MSLRSTWSLFLAAAASATLALGACGGGSNGIALDSGVPGDDGGSDGTADTAMPPADGGSDTADTGTDATSTLPNDAGNIVVTDGAWIVTGDAAFTAPLNPPQIVTAGGSVIAHPKAVPVVFPPPPVAADGGAADGGMEGGADGGTLNAGLEDFMTTLAGSSYWTATTQEHGVGPLQTLPPVTVTTSPGSSIAYTAVESWLLSNIDPPTSGWPAPDASTIYVLFYPAGTTITYGGGYQSCTSFGWNYGSVTTSQNVVVPYVIVPDCFGSQSITSQVQMGTQAATGGLISLVTNPRGLPKTGYGQFDGPHREWSDWIQPFVGGACDAVEQSFVTSGSLPYYVERAWSNAAIKAGHSPCVPALPGEVYFNVEPQFSSMVSYSSNGVTSQVLGVSIPVGGQITIPLRLYADGPLAGPWSIQFADLSTFGKNGVTPELTYSFDQTQGSAGDMIELTIGSPKAITGGQVEFAINSFVGNQEYYWLGVATN